MNQWGSLNERILHYNRTVKSSWWFEKQLPLKAGQWGTDTMGLRTQRKKNKHTNWVVFFWILLVLFFLVWNFYLWSTIPCDSFFQFTMWSHRQVILPFDLNFLWLSSFLLKMLLFLIFITLWLKWVTASSFMSYSHCKEPLFPLNISKPIHPWPWSPEIASCSF